MFTEIPGPSTLGSYNVHNVLAGSNILIWVCFVRLAVFLNPKPKWLGWKVILLCHKHFPKYWTWYDVFAQEGMLWFAFFKIVTWPFHAYVSSSPFVTIAQLEILSYNIVLPKHMAQCSNWFLTDPNWPITNPLYTCIIKSQTIFLLSLLQHILSFGISPYFSSFNMQIIWGVCATGQIYWFQYIQILQYFLVYFNISQYFLWRFNWFIPFVEWCQPI